MNGRSRKRRARQYRKRFERTCRALLKLDEVYENQKANILPTFEWFERIGWPSDKLKEDVYSIGKLISSRYEKRKKRLKDQKKEYGYRAEIRKSDTPQLMYQYYSSTYASTNNGKHYAIGAANVFKELLEQRGFTAEIVENELDYSSRLHQSYRYDLMVFVETPMDVEIIKYHPMHIPLDEEVRLMWKYGVNPRVFNPYLPYGFEARHGLDYFGNRIKGER